MPENILEKIIAQIQQDEEEFFKTFHANKFELLPRQAPVKINFNKYNAFFAIAEVKKASPSKGIIRENFNPVEIAEQYLKAGASAISILTEKNYFQGSKTHLTQIRKITRKPLLRKDFIFHPAQIYEAYNLGADLILLIVASLTPEILKSLHALILNLGMTPLIEVHNQEELNTALEIEDIALLGINNRDLKTFEVSLETTKRLMKKVPGHIPTISESGIFTQDDVKAIKDFGCRGILVGESLLRQENCGKALEQLLL